MLVAPGGPARTPGISPGVGWGVWVSDALAPSREAPSAPAASVFAAVLVSGEGRSREAEEEEAKVS